MEVFIVVGRGTRGVEILGVYDNEDKAWDRISEVENDIVHYSYKEFTYNIYIFNVE